MKQKLMCETALSSEVKEAQTGRSMVEMLGVLAIVGVLSIGGIVGYTQAMNQYKANEITNEIQKRAVVAATRCGNQKGHSSISLSEFPDTILGGSIRFYSATCYTDLCNGPILNIFWEFDDNVLSKGLCQALQNSPIAEATECCGYNMAYTPLSEIDCTISHTIWGCETRYHPDLTPVTQDWELQCGGECELQ